MLTKCDIRIPKSGKKIISLGGRNFFVRPLKGLFFVYDVKTTYLILVTTEEKKQYAFEQVLKRMDEIRRLDDRNEIQEISTKLEF